MSNLFLSHSSSDKVLARKIANDLKNFGHKVWFDEWEIHVGHSISQKIQEGLGASDFILVLLTKNSVASGWVEREWQSKVHNEIKNKNVIILPLKVDDCDIPPLLSDKKYANFYDYKIGLNELLSSLSIYGDSCVIKKQSTSSIINKISAISLKNNNTEIPLFDKILEEIKKINIEMSTSYFLSAEQALESVKNSKNAEPTLRSAIDSLRNAYNIYDTNINKKTSKTSFFGLFSSESDIYQLHQKAEIRLSQSYIAKQIASIYKELDETNNAIEWKEHSTASFDKYIDLYKGKTLNCRNGGLIDTTIDNFRPEDMHLSKLKTINNDFIWLKSRFYNMGGYAPHHSNDYGLSEKGLDFLLKSKKKLESSFNF